ncbi:MAG: hypothetical protein PVJ21_04905 [Anaerolineales bacterium]|jgi:hypothetical protein
MTRLRILIKMESADAYELKAQALNKDPRLKQAGIAALKYTGDKQYIADGEFSTKPPPPTSPETAPDKTKSASSHGRLRIVVRLSNDDSYELKAQALNDDPRLKEAGISALKFVGDKQYISGGEFSPDLPSPESEPKSTVDEKVRVTLRMPRKDAYELVTKHLNNDPDLSKAGIAGVELAKGTGLVPVAQETPAKPPKRKPRLGRFLATTAILGIVGIIGAGVILFSKSPAPAPTPTAVAQIPVSGADPTDTPTSVPPTETSIPPTATMTATRTKTLPPTATNTLAPTATVLSCQPPGEVVVAAENLSCRYGPGAVYLYRTGLVKDQIVDVLGKADTVYDTWVRVQTRWEEPVRCWVNSSPRFVEIPGGEDVACLDPLYPEKAPLIIFNTDLFPKPSNVSASRSGNLVYIQWQGYDLQPGDRPEASPPYLTETWTCQDGKIVFSPQGWDDTFASVRDDAGCDEASYGYVYMAHVDGYIGPVTIPWPP